MYVYCTMPLSGADQTRGVDKPWTNTIRRGQRRVIFYSIHFQIYDSLCKLKMPGIFSCWHECVLHQIFPFSFRLSTHGT